MIPWEPIAPLKNLQARAKIFAQIRHFFAERNVLEVETPLLGETSVTDPYIQSLSAENYFLQTSPEYAMKRLLAAGSGAIFQICKAFRQEQIGRYHQPEFTMLEWYRPGFDHHALMDEMDDLLICILKTPSARRITYADLFQDYCNINPHTITDHQLQQCVQHIISLGSNITDRNACLDLLLTHDIEPKMEKDRPIFLYDFPANQSALAKVRYDESPPCASRFEVYFRGIELANGFHELTDAAEQRIRFENNLQERKKNHLPSIPIDELFLASLSAGLPDCAGVALGLDRLIMLALNENEIAKVMSFIKFQSKAQNNGYA